ncbi:flagellar assembly protein FliW [Geothrix sp. PMB-07]|uniref:flagellar assembly protein FliW n=1 Tax=Geothrix sp. PMB-07 TaxID=3068640 RepID=UPI002740ED93|nr:flagellar assembly protein FliW [Geothrix sp. PMB-07]WLT31572.1 flagellar assembly protein FliW [Geothrix sp. PMB-07]
MTQPTEATPGSTPAPDEGTLLTFPKGLVGFPHLRAFRLVEPPDAYPLKFLQSAEDESVSFVCIDPASVKADYEVPLGTEEAQALQLEAPSDAMVLTLVVIPEDARHMTTNLAGPLVINVKLRICFQIVLSSDKYPLRFPILAPI